jgi:hypothetical protein
LANTLIVFGSAIVGVPKYITESLAKTEMYELGVIGTKHVPEELMLNDLSSMFEMGLRPAHTFLFLLDFPLYTWVLVR